MRSPLRVLLVTFLLMLCYDALGGYSAPSRSSSSYSAPSRSYSAPSRSYSAPSRPSYSAPSKPPTTTYTAPSKPAAPSYTAPAKPATPNYTAPAKPLATPQTVSPATPGRSYTNNVAVAQSQVYVNSGWHPGILDYMLFWHIFGNNQQQGDPPGYQCSGGGCTQRRCQPLPGYTP